MLYIYNLTSIDKGAKNKCKMADISVKNVVFMVTEVKSDTTMWVRQLQHHNVLGWKGGDT